MTRFPSLRSLQFQLLFTLISLQFITGFANDSSSSKSENNVGSHGASSSSVGVKVVIVCLGLVAVVAFAVLLFKIWQKKKREEQHARLLKLFEDDDELEVELGIRD
ncbi:Elongation factor [Fagus crenata]